MSVICSAPGAAPAASSGIQTRSGATGKPEHSHKLLVKGAAECLLGRSTHVSAGASDCAWASLMYLWLCVLRLSGLPYVSRKVRNLNDGYLQLYADAQLETQDGRSRLCMNRSQVIYNHLHTILHARGVT